MNPKVFISSTYLDLKQFRTKLGRSLTEIDVEILGMEKFGARTKKPLETCLEEVDKCDVYIGIIAFRYGSTEKETGKSFTQLEYERAIKKEKEIFIYLFDEEGFIQPKFIEFGENSDRLISFKENLKELHTIDTFKTPSELSSKIIEKLKLLIPSLPNFTVRPEVLRAEVNWLKIGKDDWVSIVSFLNERPFEIFMLLSYKDFFPIPKHVKKGKVIEVIDEHNKARYDFVYIDKYRYPNIVGGINYVSSDKIIKYCNALNTLLRSDVPLHTIKEIIENLDVSDTLDNAAWKIGVLKALKIK
jgi:hypothetical protein